MDHAMAVFFVTEQDRMRIITISMDSSPKWDPNILSCNKK